VGATGITDAPRPYANVRRRCFTGVDLVVYGYLKCCSIEEGMLAITASQPMNKPTTLKQLPRRI